MFDTDWIGECDAGESDLFIMAAFTHKDVSYCKNIKDINDSLTKILKFQGLNQAINQEDFCNFSHMHPSI